MRILKKKTLLALAENATKGGDNHLFKNFYVEHNGEIRDILDNGGLSCGAFVSWILLTLELIKHPHATLSGTERDLLESGWYEISEPKPGAVIIWETILFTRSNEMHSHIGFCVSDTEAVSNFTDDLFPRKHHITYGGMRKIERIYWHSELDNG